MRFLPFISVVLSILTFSGVSVASQARNLSDCLLDVATELGTSQPAAAISTVASLVKANANTIDIAAASSGGGDAIKAAIACKVFKLLFPSQYVDSSSPDYLAEVEAPVVVLVWQNSTCFFKPQTTADVAFGVKIVTTIGSKFATRSGGHSQNPGWNSITNGVLFDLSVLNGTSISADHSYATIGTGQRWGTTYDYLDQFNKAAVGGRSFDVGVGGLILGVGIPFLSSTYGFACDNVKRFQIVLPNSTVVNASSDSHSDLWKAQKGGGPNYGIVTEFDLYTIPSEAWYYVAIYNESDWKTIIPAVVKIQEGMETDADAGILFSSGGGEILFGMVYAHYSTRPAVFAPFDNIKPILELATATNGTIAKLAETVLASSADKQRYYSRAMSYQTDLQTYMEGYAAFTQVEDFNPGSGDSLAYGIQAITAAAVQAGVDRGGNWLGMRAESTNWWHAIATWLEPTQGSVKGINATVSMYNTMTSISKKNGKYVDFVFANDAEGDQPSPLASYGPENLAKMKAVAKAYDPTEIMQNLQNAGFKLSDA